MNETIRSERQYWSYMASEVFQTRYLVAAYYLRNCNHILEIGGCSTPITGYLRGAHESVTVVDPLVEPMQAETLNNRPCVVRHIPLLLQDYNPTENENGFAVLGMPQLPVEPVLRIMRRCEVSVLEFPPAYLPSCLMFKAILDSRYFDVTARIVFDFSHNEMGNLSNLHFAVRHLFVLKRRSSDADDFHLSKWLRSGSEYVRNAQKDGWRRKVRDKSASFLRDHFHSGYAFLKKVRDKNK